MKTGGHSNAGDAEEALLDEFPNACLEEERVCSNESMGRFASAPRQRLARAAILTVLVMFSVATRGSLVAVESVVGALCLVFSSLLLPTLFFIAIRRKKVGGVSPGMWVAGSLIVMFSVGLMSQIIFQTLTEI
jgi:hypothetical protein